MSFTEEVLRYNHFIDFVKKKEKRRHGLRDGDSSCGVTDKIVSEN